MSDLPSESLAIGQIVRCARERRQLSRDSLAVQAGTSVSTLIRLERDNAIPRARTFGRITAALDLSADELLALVETKQAS